MANGMASLFVGASGLKSAQTALNTTAHNLSNINTEGYTRQQIAFRDTHYLDLVLKQSSQVMQRRKISHPEQLQVWMLH